MSRKKSSRDYFSGLSLRILELRRRLGLTQAELAGRIDVNQGTIHKYEKGIAVPGNITLNKLAKLGGVMVEWLLRGETAAPEAIREHAISYARLDQDLDEDALAHVILLLRDWLRRKRDKISAPSEAKLLAKMYRHWLTDKEFPDDWVIEKLARGDS